MIDLHSFSQIVEKTFEKEFGSSFDSSMPILGKEKEKGIRYQKDFLYDDRITFHMEIIGYENGYLAMDVTFPILVDIDKDGSLLNAENRKDRVFALSVWKDSSFGMRHATFAEDVFSLTMELRGMFQAFEKEFDDAMDIISSLSHH